MAPPKDDEDENSEEPITIAPADDAGPAAGGDAEPGDESRSDAGTPRDTEADAAAAVPASSRVRIVGASSLAKGEPTLLDRVADSLVGAARQFSFPLLLAVGVGVFLLIQSRIDRKDPKLAFAPVDARDDLAVFH